MSEDHETADDATSATWLACAEAMAKGARWGIPGAQRRIITPPASNGACSDVRAFRAARRRGSAPDVAALRARRIVDSETGGVRHVLAQWVRTPVQEARALGKRYGQRRSKDRIRMRDGISPAATDRQLPAWAAEFTLAELAETVPPRFAVAFHRACHRYAANKADNGNGLRALRAAVREKIDAETAAALLASGGDHRTHRAGSMAWHFDDAGHCVAFTIG